MKKKIAAIADEITDKGKDVHLVLIAGPSSSGKTTFAQRLSIQLVVNGLRPVPISMDDYYKERLNTPRKAMDLMILKASKRSIWNYSMTI